MLSQGAPHWLGAEPRPANLWGQGESWALIGLSGAPDPLLSGLELVLPEPWK